MSQLVLIFSNIILISVAQLLLKQGANSGMLGDGSRQDLLQLVYKFSNWYVIFGAIAYFVSFLLWLYILTKYKLSFAYPLMSLSYVTVMALSIYFLKEKISLLHWSGALLIVLGTAIIFYKH